MNNLQEVFIRIQDSKKQRKELNSQYRDALTQHPTYENIKDKISKLREEKKSAEAEVQAEMGRDYDKLEEIKEDIKQDQELLSDIAMNAIAEGKSLEITDEKENQYEPIFAVRFKKIS